MTDFKEERRGRIFDLLVEHHCEDPSLVSKLITDYVSAQPEADDVTEANVLVYRGDLDRLAHWSVAHRVGDSATALRTLLDAVGAAERAFQLYLDARDIFKAEVGEWPEIDALDQQMVALRETGRFGVL